jgi:hypothetical protein
LSHLFRNSMLGLSWNNAIWRTYIFHNELNISLLSFCYFAELAINIQPIR